MTAAPTTVSRTRWTTPRPPRAIRELSETRRFDLLEALATSTADALFERFRPEHLRLRVRKRPAGLGAEHSGGYRRAAMTLAYVGLGSNLGDRAVLIARAAEQIGAARLSSVRETEPWGYENQPRFLNAVAEIETELSPRRLLDHLFDVERRLGRERVGPRWGPRTIDLDLLLYGDQVVDEPGLVVPHPHLHERRFVLEPLAELVPSREIPGLGTVTDVLAGLQSPS